jgi:hypothetical protein
VYWLSLIEFDSGWVAIVTVAKVAVAGVAVDAVAAVAGVAVAVVVWLWRSGCGRCVQKVWNGVDWSGIG